LGTSSAAAVGNYSFTLQLTAGYYLSWSVIGDELHLQLQMNRLSWLGVGVHSLESNTTGMQDADIYTCVWTNGNVTVSDRFQPLQSGPPPDDTQLNSTCSYNILPGSVWGFQNTTANTSVCQFARKLTTGDQTCDNQIENGEQLVIFAFGIKSKTKNANQFSFHGGNKGSLQVNFVSGSSSSSTTGSTTRTTTTTGNQNSSNRAVTWQDGVVIGVGMVVGIVSIANLAAAYVVWKKKQYGDTRGNYAPIEVSAN